MRTSLLSRLLLVAALFLLATAGPTRAQSAESNYQVVENWAQFPDGVTAWSGATGVDIDRKATSTVSHRNEAMPIMAFDRNGKFLRAWGQGMFKTTHSLRTDHEGNVWVTDRGDHQVFKFSPEGKLLLTLGRKGVVGENESQDAFNGVADLVIAKNGDIFIADGESTNTRVVKYSKDGKFVTWWGGLGTSPENWTSPQYRDRRAVCSMSAIAATSACRCSIRAANSCASGIISGLPGASSSKAISLRPSTAQKPIACTS